MKKIAPIKAVLFGMLAICFSQACTPKNADNGATGDSGTKVDQDLVAGEYCYEFNDKTLRLTAVMEFDGKSLVNGTMYGDIHDTVENYFATYVTTFDGKKDGANLQVKTKSEIEGDVQVEEASWPWDGQTLNEGRHLMQQVDCEPSPG